jgi:general secretion pathway protein C
MSTSKASGYKISNQISQTGLRQAGLKQGDVILSVNGQPVGNIANDRSMIDQVVAAKRVRVEVQRDTRRFFVTIPIPQ